MKTKTKRSDQQSSSAQFLSVFARVRLPRLWRHVVYPAPDQPQYDTDHSQPADQADRPCYLRIMFQNTELAKQIVPVVNNVLSIADRQQRQVLRASISHISGKRQELLEKEEQAKRNALRLATKEKIGS